MALLFHYETIGLPAHAIGMTLLAIATALTLWSGWLYFATYFGWNPDGRRVALTTFVVGAPWAPSRRVGHDWTNRRIARRPTPAT